MLVRSVGLRGGGTFAPPVQDFTPADLPGLALWLDAADPASVSLNGSAVAHWSDKSGNGRHFAQGGASQQPAYVAAQYNGRATLRFDGANDNLSIGGSNSLLRNAPGATSYVVGLTTKASGQQFFWVENNTTLSQARWQMSKTSATGNNHRLLFRQFDNGAAVNFDSGVEWETGVLHCAGARVDLGAATRTWRINGAQEAHDTSTGTSGTFSDTNSASAFVGAARNGTYWQGDICEVILLPRALTPTEVALLEAYLLGKWGIS